jgi:hypothetical protein
MHSIAIALGRCLLAEISTSLIEISALLDKNSRSLV